MSKSTPKSKTCNKKNGKKSLNHDQGLVSESESDNETCDIRESDYNIGYCNDSTILYDSDTDMHVVRENDSDCDDSYEDELDKNDVTKRILESYDSDC